MNNNKTTRCESMRKHDNSGETGEKGSEQLVTASEASRAIRKVWMNSYMAPKNPSREELRRDNDAWVCGWDYLVWTWFPTTPERYQIERRERQR